MAKHPSKRKFRRYLRGQIRSALSLGTLAAADVISNVVSDSVIEKAWISSVRAAWTLSNYTPLAETGPVMVGIAHSDYDDAEIEAWVENLASWDSGDQVGQEISKRKIRLVGVFDSPLGASGDTFLNDGKQITTKCGWMLATGQTVRIWAYNTGTVALATTNPSVKTEGHANLWPA